MSHLYKDVDEVSPYLKARKKFYAPEAWNKMINSLKASTTLYVGNLSFFTEEEQVYTLFSMCGPIRRVIMGIHKFTHLPCGFCFIEYYFHRDAMAARNCLNGTKLDDRIIRADLDPGFEAGRQYGRGQTGGQVRDDRRREFDEGRGGLPPKFKRKLEQQAVASGTLAASAAIQTQTQAYHNHYNTGNRNNSSYYQRNHRDRDENRNRNYRRGRDRFYDSSKRDNNFNSNMDNNNTEKKEDQPGFAQLVSIGSPGPRSKRNWNQEQEKERNPSKKRSFHEREPQNDSPNDNFMPPRKRSKLQ